MQFIKKIFSPIITTIRFIQENFKAMLFLLLLLLIFMPKSQEDLKHHNLEKISLIGPIMEVSTVVKQLDEASKNHNVKGILFVVDSPGGAVAPSIEVAEAIKRAKESKPVVVYASGTMASGGYYASIWANEIIANPGSMVGSIGVIIQGANFKELMDKVGISTQSVQAGKYKKVGTADRKWSDYEVDELNKVIGDTYDMFTKDVAEARGLDINKRDSFANAHIFTAKQAKDVGLVDSLGVMYDAKKRMVELSGVSEAIWNEEDKFEKFFKQLSSKAATSLHIYFPEIVLK